MNKSGLLSETIGQSVLIRISYQKTQTHICLIKTRFVNQQLQHAAYCNTFFHQPKHIYWKITIYKQNKGNTEHTHMHFSLYIKIFFFIKVITMVNQPFFWWFLKKKCCFHSQIISLEPPFHLAKHVFHFKSIPSSVILKFSADHHSLGKQLNFTSLSFIITVLFIQSWYHHLDFLKAGFFISNL